MTGIDVGTVTGVLALAVTLTTGVVTWRKAAPQAEAITVDTARDLLTELRTELTRAREENAACVRVRESLETELRAVQMQRTRMEIELREQGRVVVEQRAIIARMTAWLHSQGYDPENLP